MRTFFGEKIMNITVIGAGPGGYEAAIAAAKYGADVTLVEKDEVGGTCLNRGCIPTKAFLGASDALDAVEHAKDFGISVENVSVDYPAIVARKNKIKDGLVKGIKFLLDQNGVRLVKGTAFIESPQLVTVQTEEGPVNVESDKMIIATGSVPVVPKMFKYDGTKVITSDEILDLQEAPKSIIIVGGGVIGCEIGQFLAKMGSKVTIVEALKQILPNEDADVSKQLLRQLKREKIKVITGTAVSEVTVTDDGVKADLANGKSVEADLMLVSIGRRAYLDRLGYEKAGVETDDKGRINVDETMVTNVPNIYAIGDIVATPQLAHVASKEGVTAAQNAVKGMDKKVSYKAVPACVFTDPEVAAVGIREDQAAAAGIETKTGTFEFRGLGKAQAMGKIQGTVKIITDPEDVIIGASVIGPHASDLLAELTMAVELGLTAEQLGDVIHPHPSLSEAVMEAAHDVHGMSIHK